MSQATTTTDHDEIRRWADERGGRPSVVRTSRRKGGILRFDFGEDDEKLEETSWEEFFQIFDDSKLALLHQDSVNTGQTSRFFKFVARGSASKAARGSRAGAAPKSGASQRAPSATAKRIGAKTATKTGARSSPTKTRAAASSTGLGGAKKSTRETSQTSTTKARTSRKRKTSPE